MRREGLGVRAVLVAHLAIASVAAIGALTTSCRRVDVNRGAAKLDPTASGQTESITDVEGLDLTAVPPSRRADVLALMNEHFCYCGCPRTLAACLANKADCTCVRCSDRMASFIVREIAAGQSSADVETDLLAGFSEGYNARAATFALDGQPSKGKADAPIVVVEFADFRCPHCAAAFELLEGVFAKRDDVRLVFMYFPLGGGGETSQRAAEAAEEAHAQGKFWELAKVMFENQHALEPSELSRYAAQVGLDVPRFEAALGNRIHREKVAANKRAGEAAGVVATPTLFVNGRPFGLARTAENLEMRFAMESERGRCE
ncbi:DsbA family protein [Myxococcota bacterium]|nr:DsbA family protein [Myxococcota bacterium]